MEPASQPEFDNQISNFYHGAADFITYRGTQNLDSCKSPIYSHSSSMESPDDNFSGGISVLSSQPLQVEMETEALYSAFADHEVKIVSLKKNGNNSNKSTDSSSKENEDLIEGMNSYFTFQSATEATSADEAVSEIIKKKAVLKTENNQSIFKNKPKERLEHAKALVEELLKWDSVNLEKTYGKVMEEVEKSELRWKEDGETLDKTVKEFEKQENVIAMLEEEISKLEKEANKAKLLQTEIKKMDKEMTKIRIGKGKAKKEKTNVKKMDRILERMNLLQAELDQIKQENATFNMEKEIKQKKNELTTLKRKISPIRTKILVALEFKKFTPFASLFPLTASMKKYLKKEDYLLYFQLYKTKRSMRYFEAYMQSEELYFWMVLFSIVLALLPQDTQDLSLLPLSKSATPFMAWLVDSSVMKIKHKNLFKCSQVRAHLRNEFERVASILLMKSKQEIAAGKWSQDKESSLKDIMKALGRDWDAADYQVLPDSFHKRSWESEEVDDYLQCSESEEEELSKPQKKVFSKKH